MSETQKTPMSISELKKLRKARQQAVTTTTLKISSLDKLALWITEHVGSMGFFIIVFTWTVLWLGWNMLAPVKARFDPFPAFVLWLFISNMIQLFLMPLIMVGQNLQSVHADARAEADFDINKQAELEIETILLHLENQNKLIIEILDEIKAKK